MRKKNVKLGDKVWCIRNLQAAEYYVIGLSEYYGGEREFYLLPTKGHCMPDNVSSYYVRVIRDVIDAFENEIYMTKASCKRALTRLVEEPFK
jgi:hypothetical protein